MTDKLSFIVKKDLWLAAEPEPKFKILGWMTTKPKFDNGHIKRDIVLVFSHMFKDTLNFIMIPPGSQYEKWTAEFFQKEIESLTNEGALELIKMKESAEAAIVPGFPESGQILTGSMYAFDKEAILSKDIYIVMGQRENTQSEGSLVPGEKVTLRHLLDVYSKAVGHYNKLVKEKVIYDKHR